MARTPITKQVAAGAYAGALQALTFVAMDLANGNDFDSTGRELIIVRNDDVAAVTLTITSVDDDLGRSEDIAAESIPAGVYRYFGPVSQKGWIQADRKIWLDASDVDLMVAVVELPSSCF